MSLALSGYQIGQAIYTGARTLVYQGQRESDNKLVIIKFFSAQYPTFGELLQFRNQYTIAKNLDIPGIVQPLSLERLGNSYALVMEDWGGLSLSQYCQQQSLNLADMLDVALQLATILHNLHQQRVIHKDIKPANVLIHPESKQVKLIDFSIASLLPKETQEIQNPNILEGTLAYLAPEQTGRMNRGIDYRADFYALGVTLYQLLSGQLPFESDDPLELLHCHIAKVPVPVEQVNPSVPGMVGAIVAKLMAKNAEDRYQSALGLQHDLEQCLTQWQETGEISEFELGERDLSDRFNIPEKLYGRETEVQALLKAFERVSQGASELMLVAGFSGIGKTAVVNEVHKPITQQKGYFIKGKFDQFNRNIPLSAFVQALRDLMGQLLCESDAQLAQWQARILDAVGENGQVLIEVIPELEQVMGQQPAAPELSGSAVQNRFNLLFQKFIQVFTTAAHPLTIFLDDLQWADAASLQLLKVLMDDNGYLLVLGAYRDNEVSPAHPLMLTIAELKQANFTVNTITLTPLSLEHTNRLIADTLKCDQALAKPLTELVDRKTQGNPFFTTQFLKALHEDGYISFDQDRGYWQCDMVQVNALALTDDVVEFMALQLQKLSAETQQILKLAACIGNQFDLATLAIVFEQSPTETAIALWKALQEGLIVPTTQVYKFFQSEETEQVGGENSVNPIYRFLHDRVQQAAYSQIPENQKQSTHFSIGQLLLANLSGTKREDRLFEIVNHLNLSRGLLTQASQKEELAQLNGLAGTKAKAATAYTSALAYTTAGIELLSSDCWESQYDLSFSLSKERAEVEYLNGNFAKAEEWLHLTIDKAKTALEKAEVYNMAIMQYTLQAKYPEAIQAGRQALALVNIDLPEVDLDTIRDKELAIIQATLCDRPFMELANLPLMAQPEQKMAIKLLISMGPPTYRSHQTLWSVICAKAMNLCLQYGNTPEIGYIYPAFGGLRGYALNNYQGTGELLKVTLQLIQSFNNKSAESIAYLMIGSSLRHWSDPLSQASEDYLSSYRVGLESSNLQYAAYAFGHNMYCRFYQSVGLELLFREVGESLAFSQKYKNQWAIDLFLGGQIILSEFMGMPFGLRESDYLAQCRQHKNSQVICIFNILKSQLLLFFDRVEDAYYYGQQAEAEIINVAPQGLLPYAYHCFIYALLLIARYSSLSKTEQLSSWEKISQYQRQLEIWSNNNRVNFLHLCCLVKAESARLFGNYAEAIENYDRAIASAKAHGFIQEEALANELAAKFYLDWGKEKVAVGYMQDAYYCYTRWGAKAKVDDLETRYPQLLQPILQSANQPLTLLETLATIAAPAYSIHATSSKNTSSSSINQTLDFAALLQISQTFASTIALDELLQTLTQTMLENSGADQCVLILCEESQWQVRVMANLEQVTLQSVPLENNPSVPFKLIQYVKNTVTTVAIDDLKTDLPVIDDYLYHHQPKSVLCLPILNQGNLRAILYLENCSTRGVFTGDRILILNFLCTQAAISLENASLYQKAQNYAQQLEQSQLQIVQSEKMASLGNLVAGVAHEVNNPIGFLNGSINNATDYVQDLLDYIALYQQHHPNPATPVQEKAESIDLEYLCEDLPKVLNSMQGATDRIKSISTSLRTFSRADTEYKVSANLHEGIDSTLLILKYRLKANQFRPAIQVITNYGRIPSITCFPGQLNQVFMNILANAIDMFDEMAQTRSFAELAANPQQITIGTVARENQMQISIRDNGQGMSKAVKARIFDHLFTTKAVGKGTGLGLAIARQIVVETHGGRLQVNSQIGQGTEFVISLPQH
ncbi:trifunctional serine/threonine-protein kinase/ATP-binding protein/sensor histidine kinase [Oscillatoria acuminata]|uniref:histidine kinase n=1 Tax=Oscillatoria acuminata PCC 6304 TaxID=56110 RepID=K9TIJ9_9CYAN|nr:ATP-binding sensor histidine kinase [Oscillatoria acuminata]AFY81976.1 putative ATPase [Oscillatoria acuminata PCC 6304]